MNLPGWIENVRAVKRALPLFFQWRRVCFGARIFGQNMMQQLQSKKPYMSLPLSIRGVAGGLCWGLLWAAPVAGFAQTNYYKTNGTEYAIVSSLPGDQVFPDVALGTNGGFAVWQDNITDGNGWGISAQRLDGTLSGTLSPFRVNAQGTNDQERPRVAMLNNGGAAFVWQGGKKSREHIFARFLTPTNTFLTATDLLVSTFTNNFQIRPAVAVLTNGNIVVVWSSFNQVRSNSLHDIYGQLLSPAGQKIGANFLINQYTNYNQRAPAVAALKNGGFVVAWVSEQQRSVASGWGTNSTYVTPDTAPVPSVDIYARLYRYNAAAVAGEFLVNSNANPCANPAVAAASDGTFLVAWSARDQENLFTNSWDVYARAFSTNGAGGAVARVNSTIFSSQYIPRVSAIGLDYLVVWTSVDQDGSFEGVFGQYLHSDGSPVNGEFCVNTTTAASQMQPAVASDRVDQFLVVWAGYNAAAYNFDLFAQRHVNVETVLSAMAAPFVYAPFTLSNGVYQPQLTVSWPMLSGIAISNYEVYVDGAGTPIAVTTSNTWTMTAAAGLTTNSTRLFQLGYVTANGRTAPLSAPASGTTWLGLSWGGIPYEWMAEYFGGYSDSRYTTTYWPSATTPLAAGGPTIWQVFLSGGDPLDSDTWLKTTLTKTPGGMFLSWNTRPGFIYQVQMTTNFTSWSPVGSARFAAGTNDSLYVGSGAVGYYRILLLRQ
jgi:hypothetical protein